MRAVKPCAGAAKARTAVTRASITASAQLEARADRLEAHARAVAAQRAARVEIALGDRLDALDVEAHRRRHHLAGHLRAGGQRAEQQVARARRGARAADARVRLGLVDRAADVD